VHGAQPERLQGIALLRRLGSVQPRSQECEASVELLSQEVHVGAVMVDRWMRPQLQMQFLQQFTGLGQIALRNGQAGAPP
jgi:hypothetical protein